MKFKPVTKRWPCQICSKDNWCSRSECETVQICRRLFQPGAKIKEGKNREQYYVYRQENKNGN